MKRVKMLAAGERQTEGSEGENIIHADLYRRKNKIAASLKKLQDAIGKSCGQTDFGSVPV